MTLHASEDNSTTEACSESLDFPRQGSYLQEANSGNGNK